MERARPLRTAVVTGTAKKMGIGRSIAKAFIRKGYRVIGIDIDPCKYLEEEDDLFSENYRHIIQDVSDMKLVHDIWLRCQSAFPDILGIDVLINNAAIAEPIMPKTDIEDRIVHWRRVLDVNLSGPFILTEAFLPYMVEESSVIFISSTRAMQSEPSTEAYASSKAGLIGLTHALAISLGAELRASPIRVNAIVPGWIDTSGGKDVSSSDRSWHPVGRVGKPDDVANLCLFLASPNASFIAGQYFVIDGGVTKKMIYPE